MASFNGDVARTLNERLNSPATDCGGVGREFSVKIVWLLTQKIEIYNDELKLRHHVWFVLFW